MDALSALKMAGLPDMASPLASVARSMNTSAPTSIPAADLEKLSAGMALPQPNLPETGSTSFQNYLGRFVQEVSDKQNAAGQAVTGLLSGQNVSLHQAMISMEEANVSFQMMVEVRNRLLDSYQELMRMQV